MKHKCKFPDGVVIKPDGVHNLDPCRYKLSEIHRNVTIEVLKCSVCGHVSIAWRPQPNTEHIIMEEKTNDF